MIWITLTAMKIARKGISHSGFRPVSSRSRKVLLNTGVMRLISAVIVVVRITKTVAAPVPFSRSFA